MKKLTWRKTISVVFYNERTLNRITELSEQSGLSISRVVNLLLDDIFDRAADITLPTKAKITFRDEDVKDENHG